jgi:hypothetical protein
MIPAATSVCRPQKADPGTARREHGRHASRDPTSAENAWHFFMSGVLFSFDVKDLTRDLGFER